jgi:hypothetical protein
MKLKYTCVIVAHYIMIRAVPVQCRKWSYLILRRTKTSNTTKTKTGAVDNAIQITKIA